LGRYRGVQPLRVGGESSLELINSIIDGRMHQGV